MKLCCLTSVRGLQNNNDFIQDTEDMFHFSSTLPGSFLIHDLSQGL
jgi:hypothetical protein